MKKDNTIFLIAGITVAILILLPYIGLVPKFVISDSDFMLEREDTYAASADNITIENLTMKLSAFGIVYTLSSADSLYFVAGNSSSCDVIPTALYELIPTPEGTNRICRYQWFLLDSENVTAKVYSAIYTKEIQTVYQNVTVPGPTVQLNATSSQICSGLGGIYSNITCTCPNGSKWYDNSTSKVCGALTVTTTVTVEPNFWQKYGAAGIVFVILGGIIIYLIYKRTR